MAISFKRLPAGRSTRLALGAAALALGLLGGPFLARGAHAYISGCGTDPTVYLSNGDQVGLAAAINDSIGDVVRVVYVLHAPAGVTATNIVYDAYGSLESVTIVNDQASGHYSSTTTVLTRSTNVQVTAFLTVGQNNTRSQSGYSWQALSIYFR